MYENFYGLKYKPFSLLPDPDFLFLSSKHSVALSMLEYSLAGQAGFCAITGEIGSGKTTLIRALLRRIGRDVTLGLISNTHSSHTDLAAWSLAAFGQSMPSGGGADVYQALMLFLIDEYSAGRRCVLIVDEAQNLTLESLEELRLLSNINSERDLLLQIILVGQPQLLEKLRSPELSQFAQRISISYHLTPLSFAETQLYINHRLSVAGASRPLFSELAVGGAQYYAGGVPRLINSICDMALVYGFAESRETIDLDIVLKVVADRQESGVTGFVETGEPSDPAVASAIAALVHTSRQGAPVAPEPSKPPMANKEPVMPAEAVRSPARLAVNGLSTETVRSRASTIRTVSSATDRSSPSENVRTSSVPAGPQLEKLTEADLDLRLGNLPERRPTAQRLPSPNQGGSWFRRAFGLPARSRS